MRTIRFGRTGASVSAVSLGTWGYSGATMSGNVPVGWTGHDDGLARDALAAAASAGINHWDTADVYGNGRAEELIGSVWGEVPRDSVFLATKVGWDGGSYGHYYHPDLIRAHAERSLRLLRTDHIDLYYLHHCDFGPGDAWLDDAVTVVRELRDAGKIRFIGLSDWDARNIMRVIERVDPDVVQPYRNVVDDNYASSGLRDHVTTRDLGVAFFSPIKHGLLLGKYEAPVEFPAGDFRQRVEGFRNPAVIARMREARRTVERRFPGHAEPVLHALTGALLEGNPTACVLLGQRNPRQVAAAAAVGEALSAADGAWVAAVYRGM